MKVLVKETSNIPASIVVELQCPFDEWVEIEDILVLDILSKLTKLMRKVAFNATVNGEKYFLNLKAFDKDSTMVYIDGKYISVAELVLSSKEIKLVDPTGVEIVRFR